MNEISGKIIELVPFHEASEARSKEKFFSLKTAAYFLLNFCTFGVHSAALTFQKRRAYTHLTNQKEAILEQAQRIQSIWDSLEEEFYQLTTLNEIKSISPEIMTEFIDKGCRRFSEINLKMPLPSSPCLEYANYISTSLLHFFSFGLIGYFDNLQINCELAQLEQDMNDIMRDSNQNQEKRALSFRNKINLLSHVHQEEMEHASLLLTEAGQASLKQDRYEKQHYLVDTWEEDVAEKAREMASLISHVEESEKDLKILKMQNKAINHLFADAHDSKVRLKGQYKKATQELEDALVRVEAANALAIEVETLKSQVKNYSSFLKTQEQLGPILTHPLRQEITLSSIQAFKEQSIKDSLFHELNDLNTDYKKNIELAICAEDMIKLGFDHCFDLLTEDPSIEFNTSSLVYLSSEFIENKKAVYRALALHLTRLGQFECREGSITLFLNKSIELGFSKPIRTLTKQKVYGKKKPFDFIRIELDHVDDFTVLDPVIPYGIDPVAIKWIIQRLSDIDKNTLRILLLEPLIPDESPQLIEAKRRITLEATEGAQRLRWAIGLLMDFSYAIEKKFENVLIPNWEHKTNMCDLKPFAPLRKNVSNHATIDSELVDSRIKTECFSPELVTAIMTAKGKQKIISHKLLVENLVYPVLLPYHAFLHPKDGSVGLSQQYYQYRPPVSQKSTPFGPKGCLFSTLLALIFMDESKLTEGNVSALKHAISRHLEKNTVHKYYENEIKSTHHVTVEEYCRWLNSGFSDTLKSMFDITTGELEIKLFSDLFDIRLGIFQEGEPTKLQNGLMVPTETFFFGPNTREAFLLFRENTSGAYTALWPKLKEELDLGVAKPLINYWKSLDSKTAGIIQ